MATASVAGVLAFVLFPLTAPPTAAVDGEPRAIQPFTLDMVEGSLTLRGAEEPYAIENPTRIAGNVDTGDDGTGVISGGTFTSPRISFQQEITDPLVATVFIDADFAQVAPGSGAGSIDSDGNLLIQTTLKVDLHVEVIGITADCTAQPINLSLESIAPYDPGTGRVTIADPNFSVPAAPIGGPCSQLVGGPINDQLSGSGHAISLTLEGHIELPPPPGCPTVTEVEVTPEGGTRLGTTVTLDASVEADPALADSDECADVPDDPAGFIDFRDGSTVLATVPLVDGEASFSTNSLPAGNRNLSARYRGEPPFRASSTDPLTYLVAANPEIVHTLPEFLTTGVATEFTVELDNNGLGYDITDARLDVSLSRLNGTAAFTPALVQFEYHDGDTWVPITLTSPAARRLLGSAGGPFAFAPGDNSVVRLRVTPQASIIPGPISVNFELVEVDPDTGLPDPALPPAPAAVASTTIETSLVDGAGRRPTSVSVRPAPLGPPAQAQVVRRGYAVHVYTVGVLSPGSTGSSITGDVQVLIAGRPVPVRRTTAPSTPLADGFPDRVSIWSTSGSIGTLQALVPDDLPLGTHTLQARYLGDSTFAPGVSPETQITVLPAFDPIYDCQAPGAIGSSIRFRAQVQAHDNLPSYARAGSEVPLSNLDVTVLYDRGETRVTTTFGSAPLAVGEGRLSRIDLGIGPDGQGTATGLTRTGTLMPAPGDLVNVDQTITLQGETATAAIDGTPGEVVPVTLDSISLGFTAQGTTPASAYICTPVGEPITLGEVTIAGTTLAVSPDTGVRVGDEVTLSATVAPVGVPGNVVFSDNGTTVGVVPVAADGTASMTITAQLGTRTLKARFFGGTGVLSSEDEKALTVVATDCAPFAEPGSAAVVRLVYLELLRRCPDQAGFDFWTGRLDNGTSQEVFARSIAYTAEARGVVVDDAYQLMLGRPADTAGRAFWVQRLGANGRYDALLADLGSSDEFWQAAGATNEGFVQRVYDRLLQRPADGPGLAYWVGRLDAGVSRRVLITTLFNLDEPLGQVVRSSYEEILDRTPDTTERTTAITRLRGDSDRSGLYASLIGRPEFNQRAQGFPNP